MFRIKICIPLIILLIGCSVQPIPQLVRSAQPEAGREYGAGSNDGASG